MFSNVPGLWKRRIISHSILFASAVLTPIVAPIASLVAYIQDRRDGQGLIRRTRLVALVAAMVLIDFIGRIRVFGIWLQEPLGLNASTPRVQRKYAAGMAWYTNQIVRAITTIAPLPIDRSEYDADLLTANTIIIARHRSVFDAVLPSVLLYEKDIVARYTLKDDLQWDPNIDVVGGRMQHVFVKRGSSDLESGLRPIRELAARIDDSSAGVIFPEGTFFTEKRFARALKAIERRSPERFDAAKKLRHLLPPRPAGTLAMLEGAPEADIVMLGHVGVEPFGSLGQIIENIGDDRRRLRLKAWRFERSLVPTDPDEQIQWLYDRWLEMDEWIESHHPLST